MHLQRSRFALSLAFVALNKNTIEGRGCEVMPNGAPNVQLSIHQQLGQQDLS